MKGITRTLEIVPFDAVKLAQALSFTVVDAIEIGGTTSIKPPACLVREENRIDPFVEKPW